MGKKSKAETIRIHEIVKAEIDRCEKTYKSIWEQVQENIFKIHKIEYTIRSIKGIKYGV